MPTRYLKFNNAQITLHDAKIISLLVQGKEYPEVCDELDITINTLAHELTGIFRKTGISCARKLIVIARAQGFTLGGRYKRVRLFNALSMLLQLPARCALIAEFTNEAMAVFC